MEFFKLRGSLSRRENIILAIAGFIIFIGLWWGVAEISSKKIPVVDTTEYLPSTLDNDSTRLAKLDSIVSADSLKILNAREFRKIYPILPTPTQVVLSFPTLFSKDNVLWHTWVSVWRNFKGYFWAILLSLPLGFTMGLFPGLKGMFRNQVDALRYLPLTALTGLFILWFGTTEEMKVAFLAFGILVYLLPVVVQRIDEVEETYLKTVFTLGANTWQTIRSVFIPSVMSKLMDDIRVLTAISWTYIIIAEYINREDGIGGMIQLKQRFQKRPDMFGILIIIILVGFLQDRIFVYLDKRLFPHKYHKQALKGIKEVEYALYAVAGVVALKIFQEIWFADYGDSFNNFVFIVLTSAVLLILYGEFNIRTKTKKA